MVLTQFHDHEGFDGVILGHPQQPYHLEFTAQRGHQSGKALPTSRNGSPSRIEPWLGLEATVWRSPPHLPHGTGVLLLACGPAWLLHLTEARVHLRRRDDKEQDCTAPVLEFRLCPRDRPRIHPTAAQQRVQVGGIGPRHPLAVEGMRIRRGESDATVVANLHDTQRTFYEHAPPFHSGDGAYAVPRARAATTYGDASLEGDALRGTDGARAISGVFGA